MDVKFQENMEDQTIIWLHPVISSEEDLLQESANIRQRKLCDIKTSSARLRPFPYFKSVSHIES